MIGAIIFIIIVLIYASFVQCDSKAQELLITAVIIGLIFGIFTFSPGGFVIGFAITILIGLIM